MVLASCFTLNTFAPLLFIYNCSFRRRKMIGFGLQWLMTMLLIMGSMEGSISSISAEVMNPIDSNSITPKLPFQSMKLQDNINNPTNKDEESMNLQDYGSINPVPVPSSTASIRPGPVQHGSPQIPYIPKPPPPPTAR